MLSDNLGTLISLDPLRAVVPTDDMSSGVEHENGVVLHSFNEQAESFLTLPQLKSMLECPGSLLKVCDRAESLFYGAQSHITFAGHDSRMLGAHLQERLDMAIVIESGDWIGAKQ